ncbi:MAG: hypothetical protein EOM76_10245 [Sphingobacteriia bacterium]|nr:hypothetical protein [Sphingobacteriia bacterium]
MTKLQRQTKSANTIAAIITAICYIIMVLNRLDNLITLTFQITATITLLNIIPAIGLFVILKYFVLNIIRCIPGNVISRPTPRPRKWYYALQNWRIIRLPYKYYYKTQREGKRKEFKLMVDAVESAYSEPYEKIEIYSINRRKPVIVVDVYVDKYGN